MVENQIQNNDLIYANTKSRNDIRSNLNPTANPIDEMHLKNVIDMEKMQKQSISQLKPVNEFPMKNK